MTSLWKKICKYPLRVCKYPLRALRKAGAFSIIEVMVALSIISIAVTTTLNLFASAARWMSVDAIMQKAMNSAEMYVSRTYLAADLRQGLFSDDEWKLVSQQRLPFMLPPKRVDVDYNIFMLVNRKVSRLTPLLVDLGIETVVDYHKKNKRNRSFWIETTLSELYLKKMN